MKELLLQSRAKSNITKVASIAVEDKSQFKELIRLMEDDQDVYLASLAAWAMSDAVSIDLELVNPYYRNLIILVKKTNSDGIKRSIVRVWQFVNIPQEHAWEIADICFKFLIAPKETIAVKAYSVTALQSLVKRLPELKEEVLFEIEKQLPHSGPAFRARAKAFLKANS